MSKRTCRSIGSHDALNLASGIHEAKDASKSPGGAVGSVAAVGSSAPAAKSRFTRLRESYLIAVTSGGGESGTITGEDGNAFATK